jgi:hypothetical protein
VRTVTPMAQLPAYLRDSILRGDGRAMCPRCDGGTARETTLSIRVSEEGLTTMLCYRSSCGAHINTLLGNAVYVQKKMKVASVYRNPTIPLQGEAVTLLEDSFGLLMDAANAHGWRLNEHGTELVLSIRDPYGREIGHITRTLSKPKRVYTYKATSQPFLDYWLVDPVSPVVVVEDALSACRLAGLGYNAVALLGTSMSTRDAKQIAEAAEDRSIFLALDRDAFDKSLKIARRHAHVISFAKILCLEVDIKNMLHDNDIRNLIDGRNDTTRRTDAQSESA